MQWYFGCLPHDLGLMATNEVVVSYLHEVKLNDKVNVYYNPQQKDKDVFVTCEMVNAATDQLSCRIETMHKKN